MKNKKDDSKELAKGKFRIEMEKYIDKKFEELTRKINIKEEHVRFTNKMKEALKELQDIKMERIQDDMIFRLNDKTSDHEKRICVLERK